MSNWRTPTDLPTPTQNTFRKKTYLEHLKTELQLQMELKELKPRKALNKAFLKAKPNRAAK